MSNDGSRKRAVIYTRVSRDDTGEGKSNARQREACEKLADMREWTVTEVCEDSISAYSGKTRPGWQRVLSLAESGEVDVVVAWKLDRITRTVRELSGIIDLSRRSGVAVVTVEGDLDMSNESGKAVATILGAVAEMEVERKGARQRSANAQRRAEGQPWRAGWRAFGYELEGTLVEGEADLIRQAADDVLAGTSLREIVRRWKALGISTPRSDKGVDGWTHNGVRSILLNPRNAGLATYKGQIVGKGVWEPIIAEATHARLVARLTDPARLTRARSRGRLASNLLSGLARCATCGETVNGGTGHKGSLIYQCKGYHVSTDRAEADEIVRRAFASAVALTRPGLLMPTRSNADAEVLRAEAQRLRDSLAELSTSFAGGRITIEQVETATAALRDRLAAIERGLSEAEQSEEDARTLRAENVREFMALDLAGQRAILSRLAVVVLYPKGRGRKNVPITEQVTMHLRATHPPTKKNPTPSEYLLPALADRTGV